MNLLGEVIVDPAFFWTRGESEFIVRYSDGTFDAYDLPTLRARWRIDGVGEGPFDEIMYVDGSRVVVQSVEALLEGEHFGTARTDA